jgi:hypothetical protein
MFPPLTQSTKNKLNKNHMKKYLFLAAILTISTSIMAQKPDNTKTQASSSADSLLNSLSTDDKDAPVVIFKSSRMILSQSSETVKKNNLNFLIIHRFGDFAGKDGGGQTYFGLDDVSDVYLGFEYGLTDNLNVDIGRTTIGGLADLEVKYAALHQTKSGSPLAITLIGEGGVRPYGSYTTFDDRMSYFAQAIFARKFSEDLSLQIAPSYTRDNLPIPDVAGNQQQFVSLSGTARIRLSAHMGFIVDYAHPFSSYRTSQNGFHDPFGFGIEIETGGHVFTLNVTNARAVDEINYLSNTQSSFSKGQYRIGFTISRMFQTKHKKED